MPRLTAIGTVIERYQYRIGGELLAHDPGGIHHLWEAQWPEQPLGFLAASALSEVSFSVA